MQGIRIEDRLTVRFPGRDASFVAGVEIGMLATLMAMGIAEFARSIATDNVAQARELARGFGYHVLAAEPEIRGNDAPDARPRRPAASPSPGGDCPLLTAPALNARDPTLSAGLRRRRSRGAGDAMPNFAPERCHGERVIEPAKAGDMM